MREIARSAKESVNFFLSKKGAIIHALLFLFVLGLTFYLTFGRGAVESLIDQTLARQKAVVEVNALAIEDFIDQIGKSLTTLSDNEGVVSGAGRGEAMDKFIDNWSDSPVNEVIYANPEGEVEYISNLEGGAIQNGSFVGDREYFIGAKEIGIGSYYIGEPIRARFGIIEDEYLIPVSTAVYSDEGDFRGVLGLNIGINKFVEQYLDAARITESSKIYLLNTEGEFLYNDIEEDIGKNVLDFIGEDSFVGSKAVRETLEERLASPDLPGTIDVVLPASFQEEDAPLQRQLIAYAPVFIDNNNWILALRLSVNEALLFVGPFYSRQIIAFVILFLLFLAISIRIARIEGIRQGMEDTKR